ncbi:MAG: Ig domain-containing protein [Blautia sp.]
MRKFVKTFAVAASMTMALGISSQAAVKSVSVAEPVRSTISKVHTVDKKVPCYHIYRGKGAVNSLTLKPVVNVTKGSSKAVTFKSNNPKVATVSASGKVYFKKAGNVRITVTSKADAKKSTTVRFVVKDIEKKITSLKTSTNNVTMAVGQRLKVTTKITPSTATCKNLRYDSSNSSIVTFQNGVLKAKKAGTTTVKVKAVDGSKKVATIKVTVKAAQVSKVDDDKTVDKVAGKSYIKWSNPTKAKDQINALVAGVVKNNAIPESKKTSVQLFTVKILDKGGLRIWPKRNRIESEIYAGRKFENLGINANVDAQAMKAVLSGLATATENLKSVHRFTGTLTLACGDVKVTLSNITVSNSAIRFTSEGAAGSVIFTKNGAVRFANCPTLAKYFSTVTNGAIG